MLCPRCNTQNKAINIILYLILLSITYQALRPIASTFLNEISGLLILQITLSVIAIVLVLWIAIILCRAMPGWLNQIRQAMVERTPYDEISPKD